MNKNTPKPLYKDRAVAYMTSSVGDISSTTDFIMTKDVVVQKRPHENDSEDQPPVKTTPKPEAKSKLKWNVQALQAAANAVQAGVKSPVSVLNELNLHAIYKILEHSGPSHCPSFTISLTIADMTFEGWGHSKRDARAAAARSCLTALLARAGRVISAPSHIQEDFTIDDTKNSEVSGFQCIDSKFVQPNLIKRKISHGKLVPSVAQSSTVSVASPPSVFGTRNLNISHKSPINILYENYPELKFECMYGDGTPLDSTSPPQMVGHSMRFRVTCQVNNKKFEGYGSSKKLAKIAAARSALAVLVEDQSEPINATSKPLGFLPQTLADHIGQLVNGKFNELMKDNAVHAKRKVLAGIVLTVNNNFETAQVIAVTTGTKCVSGEHMSIHGYAVNDCHAEVVARRCLQRWLYTQLLTYALSKDPKVPIKDSDIEPVPTGGYQLKPDRKLHLYISTATCGDGRIFSPHEEQESEPDRHPNRLARGQLRTKIESGEGTIPVKNCSNIIQTWDGVMQGERLLTMSCSDKLARWCVVGVQGSLLSRFLKPVYFQSVVLGSLLHPQHMYRAICGRIETTLAGLPPPFEMHRPLLAKAASIEARTPARAPSFSVSWCYKSPIVEIINATTGKLENGQPSFLCKQSMFAQWLYLVAHLKNTVQGNDNLTSNLNNLPYNEAKQLNSEYQLAKQRLIEAFGKAKLGCWVKKPLEQDQFVCEVTDAEPSALFAYNSLLHQPSSNMSDFKV